MTVVTHENLLESIRREIDAIDDELVDLVVRRVNATERVRLTKGSVGALAVSPFRPAREARILRRLLGHAKGKVDPDFLVRLWRVILSSSTLAQAPISIHVSRATANDVDLRLMIAAHFCAMPVVTHDDEKAALAAVRTSRCDLTVLAMGSAWADGLATMPADGPQLIGSLPVIQAGGPPRTLIAGYVQPQPSGDDETLLLTRQPISTGDLPAIRWQMRSGNWTVSGLAGYLESSDGVFTALMTTCKSLSPRIAGRIPRPIEDSP